MAYPEAPIYLEAAYKASVEAETIYYKALKAYEVAKEVAYKSGLYEDDVACIAAYEALVEAQKESAEKCAAYERLKEMVE